MQYTKYFGKSEFIAKHTVPNRNTVTDAVCANDSCMILYVIDHNSI